MNGKGDTQRPVNRERFSKNFEIIRWKSKKKEWATCSPKPVDQLEKHEIITSSKRS